jgi:hypothetical protein
VKKYFKSRNHNPFDKRKWYKNILDMMMIDKKQEKRLLLNLGGQKEAPTHKAALSVLLGSSSSLSLQEPFLLNTGGDHSPSSSFYTSANSDCVSELYIEDDDAITPSII